MSPKARRWLALADYLGIVGAAATIATAVYGIVSGYRAARRASEAREVERRLRGFFSAWGVATERPPDFEAQGDTPPPDFEAQP